MLNENDVLITIMPFMKTLSSKGYITQTLENVTVTRLGLLACKK